ncbi:MAG: bifunctional folylpolyglutamate synthase/dihydrofolate synthase [Phycisphaerae bacterium]|nr:bifunctional folylpolyglutamate synthase/dihydrofolate synthase [Phycisphaerae bacterium]
MGKTVGNTGRRRARLVEVEPPPSDAGVVGVPETHAQALAYLARRTDFERQNPVRIGPDAFKLDRMRALLEALGNPQDGVRCVHVAGTKGKGSTCEMAASCLEGCGYTVGIYTSPHLLDVRERIRINRERIAEPDFGRACGAVAAAAERIARKHGEATFFEVLTAMGLLHFAEQAVDVAVIEVGLGGRLDSTNVIVPEVAAVTSISLDHTQLLGDTVEKIAVEKAGIFKPGVPALTIQQDKGVVEAMRGVAERVGAPFQVVGGAGSDIDFSFRFEYQAGLGPHARVCVTTPRSNFEHLPVPLKGEHQALNCGLALAILDKLGERGFNITESGVTRGLERTTLPGRFELAWSSPRILLDGAHNPASIKCLVKAIGANLPYDSMVVVFGCCSDKDIPGMLRTIATGADKVIFTRASGNRRAASPGELARRYVEAGGKMSQIAESLPAALELAARAVARDDLICVTGSFYLVGEAKRYLEEVARKRAAR